MFWKFLFNPAPEFLSSPCSLRNSIPACLGLFGYPVPLVRNANFCQICYRSLRNYGCYEFRFAPLYRKSALKWWGFKSTSITLKDDSIIWLFAFHYVLHVTKCKNKFKIGSNPVIMPGMVWYGMVWCGGAGAIFVTINTFYIYLM